MQRGNLNGDLVRHIRESCLGIALTDGVCIRSKPLCVASTACVGLLGEGEQYRTVCGIILYTNCRVEVERINQEEDAAK